MIRRKRDVIGPDRRWRFVRMEIRSEVESEGERYDTKGTIRWVKEREGYMTKGTVGLRGKEPRPKERAKAEGKNQGQRKGKGATVRVRERVLVRLRACLCLRVCVCVCVRVFVFEGGIVALSVCAYLSVRV